MGTIPSPSFERIRIVGPQWGTRSHELRDLLTRIGIPPGWYLADSDTGRQLLRDAGEDGSRLPVGCSTAAGSSWIRRTLISRRHSGSALKLRPRLSTAGTRAPSSGLVNLPAGVPRWAACKG
jgi:hypothetical protein